MWNPTKNLLVKNKKWVLKVGLVEKHGPVDHMFGQSNIDCSVALDLTICVMSHVKATALKRNFLKNILKVTGFCL